MKERPGFSLMKQTDVQTIYHMQMPRWLFSDPRYADMSLDAKVTYTFLLNRFQLSRRNGWVNDYGEVFVIFPRKELARELRVGEKRVTAAFQTLAALNLIWEKRCGRGDANQIYLAHVQPKDDPGYTCAPFVPEESDYDGSRTAHLTGQPTADYGAGAQEPPKSPVQSCQSGASRTAGMTGAEPSKQRPSYIKSSHTDSIYTDVSQPVNARSVDGQADDEEELMGILDACELHCFFPEVARVFENAIERLFYLDHFRVGGATLPRNRVRAQLKLLDGMILRNAERKLRANLDKEVKNSTAYTMATIFNCIAESESDLMVDPELNRMSAPTGRW
jgi:hypothetical protein